jgi:hypothetical protein
MCYYIQNNKVIILLEMSNKCRNDQCPTSKNAGVVVQIRKRRPNLLEEAGRVA